MLPTIWIDVLTFGHILSAVVWLGGIVTVNVALSPLLGRFSPATRNEVLRYFAPRFARLTAASAGLTVVFGFGLYAAVYSGASAQWMMTIGVGIVVALVAFVLGMVVTVPTSLRLSRMIPATEATVPSEPPPENLARALRTLRASAGIVALLLVVVLALMVASAQL